MTYPQKVKHLEEVIEMLEKEVETLRMQLAACGVIAMCNTKESFVRNQLPQDSPYRCASYEDCENAALREIDLLEINAELLEALEAIVEAWFSEAPDSLEIFGKALDYAKVVIAKAKETIK